MQRISSARPRPDSYSDTSFSKTSLICLSLAVLLVASFGLSISSPNSYGASPTSASNFTTSTPRQSTSGQAPGNATVTPSITIDNSLFMSTVPSYPSIGKNYTVRVLITNTFEKQVPIIVQLKAPVDVVQIHPLLLHTFAVPGQQLMANFTIVVFNGGYKGPIGLTVLLWVWPENSTGPQLGGQVSTLMYGANPSFFSGPIIALTSMAILATVMVSAFYYLRHRRQPHGYIAGSNS